jgi:hypothetical protein
MFSAEEKSMNSPFDGITDVSAGADTLMRHAPMTIESYLISVVAIIDSVFGSGYAEQHPELVGPLVVACTQDFHAAYVKLGAQDIRDAMERSALDICDAIDRLTESRSEGS